MLIDKKWTGKK